MRKKLLKTAGFCLALGVVGVLGILVGRIIPNSTSQAKEFTPAVTGLAAGEKLPSVVLSSAAGEMVSTEELFGAAGCVVLFVEPECEACEGATARWQEQIDAARIDAESIVGITISGPEQSEAYRKAHGLTFPIFQDIDQAFFKQHGVNVFPYEIVVGSSGTMHLVGQNPAAPIDVEKTLQLMAM